MSILAGPTELASLLGLRRPSVVTNWRSRYPDFPVPRSGGSSPQYDVVEVMRWLLLSGSRLREVPVIAGDRWWDTVAAAFRTQAEVPSPRATMVSLVLLHCVLHRDLGREGAEQWAIVVGGQGSLRSDGSDDPRRLVDALVKCAKWAELRITALESSMVPMLRVPPHAAGAMSDLVRALQWYVEHPVERSATASPTAPWRGLLDAVLALDVDARPMPSRVTGRSLAALVAALGEVPAGAVVFDPAAGEGAMLLAAARRSGGTARLVGQELDRDTWRIARSVLAVHEVVADLGDDGRNSITDDAFPDLRADVVLVDPPVGSGAPQLDLWVEHGLRHLAPGGRLVVALPMSELVEVRASRRSANTRLARYVQQLALARRINAVVAVPRGVRRDVVGPLALMVMSNDPAQHTSIDVGMVRQLPGVGDDRTIDDGALDIEADGMVARLRGRRDAAGRPGSDHLQPGRVDAAALFAFLESAAVQLETAVAKGPRSGRSSSAAPRAMKAEPAADLWVDAIRSAPDVDEARQMVELAYRLYDAVERGRHSLDEKQAMAVLNAAERVRELVEPLTEHRDTR